MKDTLEIPVTFTETAIAELKNIIAKEGLDSTKVIRVGVKGGGCSGMTYLLGLDEQTITDVKMLIDGIKIVCDQRHIMYIANMEIDYQDGLNSRGFEFKNPNAKTTCGCGTSFSV